MPTFTEECHLRIAMVEQTAARLYERLEHPGVQETLGETALQLSAMTQNIYTPEVSPGGTVSIPSEQQGLDNVPVLGLRPHEIVWRDLSFVSFSPLQRGNTVSGSHHFATQHFDMVAAQFKDNADDTHYTAMIHQPNDTLASPSYLTYGFADFPKGYTTYFQFRPLALLRFLGEDEPLRPNALANTLLRCRRILEFPIVTVEDAAHLQMLHDTWSRDGDHVVDVLESFFPALDNRNTGK